MCLPVLLRTPPDNSSRSACIDQCGSRRCRSWCSSARSAAKVRQRCLPNKMFRQGSSDLAAVNALSVLGRSGAQEEKEGGGEALVLLLRPQVCGRGHAHPAPEGQALQVHALPQAPLQRVRPARALPPGAPLRHPEVRPCAPAAVRVPCGGVQGLCGGVRGCARLLPCRSCSRAAPRCRVPSAKAGRESIDLEIFGMAGIPEGATPGNPLLDGRFDGMQQRLC